MEFILAFFVLICLSGCGRALADGLVHTSVLVSADCKRFKGIDKATMGRIKYDHTKIDGGCRLTFDKSAELKTDKKIVGFGNNMILIISDKAGYNRLRRFVGPQNKIRSEKKVGKTSLNEKIFTTPAFSVECDTQSATCQIIMAPGQPGSD